MTRAPGKRLFDATVAAVGLVVTSPLIAAAALAVKLDSPGPAIYRGVRVGRGGKTFHMYKLRTMRLNADREGPAVTGANDRRITSVGRFLRRTKLDELPQLVNVLRGDMSLVGPRPEAPDYVQHYTPEQREVLAVRPGITSPASIAFIDEERILGESESESRYITSVMPQKLALERQYIEGASFTGDLKILARTLWLIVRRPRRPG